MTELVSLTITVPRQTAQAVLEILQLDRGYDAMVMAAHNFGTKTAAQTAPVAEVQADPPKPADKPKATRATKPKDPPPAEIKGPAADPNSPPDEAYYAAEVQPHVVAAVTAGKKADVIDMLAKLGVDHANKVPMKDVDAFVAACQKLSGAE